MTDSQRVCIVALKYAPVVSAGVMLLHVLRLALGCSAGIAEWACGTAVVPSIVMLLTSHAFHFCRLHKAFIVYTMLVDGCCNVERAIGFGCLLTPMRVLMILAGVALFALLWRQRNSYDGNDDGAERGAPCDCP